MGESIADMVLQERMTRGEDFDRHMAGRIAKDVMFKEGLDYMDESVERLAQRPVKTNESKRKVAVQGSYFIKSLLFSLPYFPNFYKFEKKTIRKLKQPWPNALTAGKTQHLPKRA